MNAEQKARIPDALLAEDGTRGLREWLRARGQRMSLQELADERARRGIATRYRKARAKR